MAESDGLRSYFVQQRQQYPWVTSQIGLLPVSQETGDKH
jgi:hypothetical protein